jgi:hypothetical protein
VRRGYPTPRGINLGSVTSDDVRRGDPTPCGINLGSVTSDDGGSRDLTVRPEAGDLSTADALCQWPEAAAKLKVPTPPWSDVLDPDLVKEGRQDEEWLLRRRSQKAQEVRETVGAPPENLSEEMPNLGAEARVAMAADQWVDQQTRRSLHQLTTPKAAAELPDGGGGGRVLDGRSFRAAGDGALETAVQAGPSWDALPREARWVIVVTEAPGGAGPFKGTSWRAWVFKTCHCGALGGHRDLDRTLSLVERAAWWWTMRDDAGRCGLLD